MGKIHHLSPHVIAKIAAGEVIERPAFAVKELIENAIDADATDINIIIEESGLKRIYVSDNGEGMDKEDLEKCWKSHTTSKIKEEDSLESIRSFGFRGEALASLAAVSHLIIQSRTKNHPTGNAIEIRKGQIVKQYPIGMSLGTTVISENLFSEIPVRKKFLKSYQTEFRHIMDIVQSFVIAYPNIRFSLMHNNRILLQYGGKKSLEERIQSVVGLETFSFFIPINRTNGYISLSGFIAKPQIHTSVQSKQFIFVNKRKVTDKRISLAVKEAYGTMLESNSYPLFVLFFDLPSEMIDVNVHPRKEEVAFLNNNYILQVIKEAVMETLEENNITFQNLSWKRLGVGTTNSFAANILKENVLSKNNLEIETNSSVIQINNLFIFYQTKHNVIILDQHAAHERIIFEKLRKEFLKQKKKNKSIQLKNPFVLSLSENEHLMVKEHRKIFSKLGFIIVSPPEQNKKYYLKNKIIITHMPYIFQDRNPQELISQILEDIIEETGIKDVDKISEEMIAFLACRSAVKAGDILTENQMKNIVTDLDRSPNNATCPHGRPTSISLSLEGIASLFKR